MDDEGATPPLYGESTYQAAHRTYFGPVPPTPHDFSDGEKGGVSVTSPAANTCKI